MIYFELKNTVSFKVWESFHAPRDLLQLYNKFKIFAESTQKEKVGRLEVYKELANKVRDLLIDRSTVLRKGLHAGPYPRGVLRGPPEPSP